MADLGDFKRAGIAVPVPLPPPVPVPAPGPAVPADVGHGR